MDSPRLSTSRGASLLGSLIILAILGILFYLAYGRSSPGVAVPTEGGGVERIAPQDARRHLEAEVCRSTCARTQQLCRATAKDEAARSACGDRHADCTAACEEPAR